MNSTGCNDKIKMCVYCTTVLVEHTFRSALVSQQSESHSHTIPVKLLSHIMTLTLWTLLCPPHAQLCHVKGEPLPCTHDLHLKSPSEITQKSQDKIYTIFLMHISDLIVINLVYNKCVLYDVLSSNFFLFT